MSTAVSQAAVDALVGWQIGGGGYDWAAIDEGQARAIAAAVVAALGLTEETDDDGRRPHKFPEAAIGEEVLSWKCAACGEWIREFGNYEPGECSVNWLSKGRTRLVSEWTEAQR